MYFPIGAGSTAASLLPALQTASKNIPGVSYRPQAESESLPTSATTSTLTSSREEADMETGYRLGVNSYIQKAVDFEQFRHVVKGSGFYWLLVNQPPPPNIFRVG